MKRLFADDCVCYRRIKNIQESTKLQEDINHLAHWENSWCMRFELSKCKTMYITRKTTQKITHPYTIWGVLFLNLFPTQNNSESRYLNTWPI